MQKTSTPLQRYRRVDLPAGFPYQQQDFIQRDAPIRGLHRHEVLEVGYCHEGHGIFAFADKILPYGPGSVNVVSPAEYHFAQSRPGTSSRWSFCWFDPLAMLGATGEERRLLADDELWGSRFPNILDPAAHGAVCTLVALLVDEGRRRERHWQSVVRGLIRALMVQLNRLPRGGGLPAVQRRRDADLVAPAIALMAGEPGAPIAIDALAARCGCRRRRFERAFLRATGMPPKRYLLRLRVHQAAEHLAAGASVLDAGLTVGFDSPSSFYRQFHHAFGCSPKAWQDATGAGAALAPALRRSSRGPAPRRAP